MSCTQIAQAELGEQPDQPTGRQNLPPSIAHFRGGYRQNQWREEEKCHIHRKDVKKGGTVKQQDGPDNSERRDARDKN